MLYILDTVIGGLVLVFSFYVHVPVHVDRSGDDGYTLPRADEHAQGQGVNGMILHPPNTRPKRKRNGRHINL